MQNQLFQENNTEQKNTTLVIGKKNKQPLNKVQQAFNSLVKKIETLRQKVKKTSDALDNNLTYYSKYLHPLEREASTVMKEMVARLYECFLNAKHLNKKEKELLKDYIAEQLSYVHAEDIDDEMKEIFEAVNEISFEQSEAESFDDMREKMETMFNEMGLDVDLSDMHKDMTQEEMARKMKLLQEDLKNREEANVHNKTTRKKTAKQKDQEEKQLLMDEARNINLKNIYKQLAKVFHPDLEQDEERKQEKEVLMKQLTIAYNNKDLHSLLKLELEWINKEEERLSEIADEKLKIYNAVLKEQVDELQQEIFMIKQHPRYEPLSKYLDWRYQDDVTKLNFAQIQQEIAEEIKETKMSIEKLKGPNSLKELKKIILNHKEEKMNDMFNLPDFMFK